MKHFTNHIALLTGGRWHNNAYEFLKKKNIL